MNLQATANTLIEAKNKIFELAGENAEKFFELYIFEQTWGNTSMFMGGIGGDQITSSTVVVLISTCDKFKNFVFFGGGYGYEVDNEGLGGRKFREDLRNSCIAGMNSYKKRYSNKE